MAKLLAALAVTILLTACSSLPQLGAQVDVSPPPNSLRAEAESESDTAAPRPTATSQAPSSDQYTTLAEDPETTASVPVTRSTVRNSKRSGKKRDEPLKPYSPEWWAREKEVDDQLKKVMIICNGC